MGTTPPNPPERTSDLTRIAIDPGRVLGQVDSNVFGGFVEHLGRCIYGGLYEEGSPLSDDRGFRKDVLNLLRELRMGVLRWPGGNFVSNYHWQDGIGPKDDRPPRRELAWGGTESNRFGTDEFLAYCDELGTLANRRDRAPRSHLRGARRDQDGHGGRAG
jgi:alpha-N-arabinofuranosidase